MSVTMWAACPACARHVRLDEPSCPFCQAGLPASFRGQKPPTVATRKLNRAALHALRMGAASATAVAAAACGGMAGGAPADPGVSSVSSSTGGAIADAADDAPGDAPYAIALYGGFVGVDAAYGGSTVAPFGDGGSPDGDASTLDDGSPSDAAEQPDAVRFTPPYGGFAVPSGGAVR